MGSLVISFEGNIFLEGDDLGVSLIFADVLFYNLSSGCLTFPLAQPIEPAEQSYFLFDAMQHRQGDLQQSFFQPKFRSFVYFFCSFSFFVLAPAWGLNGESATSFLPAHFQPLILSPASWLFDTVYGVIYIRAWV